MLTFVLPFSKKTNRIVECSLQRVFLFGGYILIFKLFRWKKGNEIFCWVFIGDSCWPWLFHCVSLLGSPLLTPTTNVGKWNYLHEVIMCWPFKMAKPFERRGFIKLFLLFKWQEKVQSSLLFLYMSLNCFSSKLLNTPWIWKSNFINKWPDLFRGNYVVWERLFVKFGKILWEFSSFKVWGVDRVKFLQCRWCENFYYIAPSCW